MSRLDFSRQYASQREKQATNTAVVTEAQYNAIVNDLIEIRGNGGPYMRHHYSIFRKYDIVSSGSVHKVVRKQNNKEVIHEGELFNVIHAAHTSQGHCGRDKLCALIADKFANVPRKAVQIYLGTCRTCEEKKARPRSTVVTQPIVETDIAKRAQIDLIDWHSERQDGYAYILNYQDHLSKLVVLRPLKQKAPKMSPSSGRHILSFRTTQHSSGKSRHHLTYT